MTLHKLTEDGFHGIWLHFQRARVQLYARIQARKCYIKSLPSVLKDIKMKLLLKAKGSLYSRLLIAHFPFRSSHLLTVGYQKHIRMGGLSMSV